VYDDAKPQTYLHNRLDNIFRQRALQFSPPDYHYKKHSYYEYRTTAKVASYSWIAISKVKEDTVPAPYAPKSSIITPKQDIGHLGCKKLAASLATIII
jgi:hypothetical protein